MIERNGIFYKFPSSEHAFMSFKNDDLSYIETCANPAKQPAEIKALGRTIELVPNWDEIKVSVMEKVLRAKFTQNTQLGQRLLFTGDRELVEGNTWNDKFWGVCNGEGENHLGKLLMKIRSELRATA
jgi:ribA/ribD-fused uncharacterized protein